MGQKVEAVGEAVGGKLDQMDDSMKAMMHMLQAVVAQNDANFALLLAENASKSTKANNRRGSLHSAKDQEELADLRAKLDQARADNAALAAAKVHVDQNDAAAAAAAIANSGASDDLKESAAALVAQGNAAQAKKDWPAAVELFRRATEKDSEVVAAWFGLGYCLQEGVKDVNGAIAAYRRALEINPNHAMAHINLGNLLMGNGDKVNAEASYRRALKIGPTYAMAHWNLSMLLESKGDVKGAIASTEGYIAAGNPDNDGEQRLERLKKKLET